jgi:predicted nucleic acid-binding protein
MKILLDTNILLYAMDKSSKYHSISVGILENEKFKLFTSLKNISELISVNSKKGVDKKITLNFITETILEISELIFPTKKSFNEFLKIISNYEVRGNKVYDMEIVSIMLAHELDTIATFNHKDFIEIDEIKILHDCL